MDFIDKALIAYAEAHTESENDLLKRIERDTYAHVLMPRMLSGHLQGRILSMICSMISPATILEIGTFTGYSALCMAEHLKPGGKLTTIDINEELYDRVQQYFDESPYQSQIDFKIGNALEIIPTLPYTFDLVFIDADKLNYPSYFDLVIDKVRAGGFIIADNVLWSGKVTDPAKDKRDKDLEAILLFNQKVHQDARVSNLLLPVRDGLMILRRL